MYFNVMHSIGTSMMMYCFECDWDLCLFKILNLYILHWFLASAQEKMCVFVLFVRIFCSSSNHFPCGLFYGTQMHKYTHISGFGYVFSVYISYWGRERNIKVHTKCMRYDSKYTQISLETDFVIANIFELIINNGRPMTSMY